ncbi:TPA: hypothetical protein ACH3X1_005701 [Trebouxia sp. C0004]
MHNQQRQCTAPTESLSQTGESSFWLWEGHPKQFQKPVAEAEDAAAWAVKSGKLQQQFGMRYANSSMPSQLSEQHQQQFLGYWSQQDDRILSPYMPGYQSQEPRPNSSPALSIEPVTDIRNQGSLEARADMVLPEEFEDDYLLMESLDLPASTLPRSNSAHDLGETIDPELLPDLEALQESFEIPAQLRLDVSHAGIPLDNEHRSQAPYTHQDHGHEQHHLSTVDHFNRSQGGASTNQQTAAAQPVSGAATPSRPCSTASHDSLQPGPQYLHSNVHQQPHGDSTHSGGQSSPAGPVRLAHSKSLPLLEDIDGLTELQQQAADMLADGLDDNLWYPMQHDEVVAQDTAAALEGLDLAATVIPSPGMPRAMSSDLDCPQAHDLEDWQDYDPAEQTGVHTMSTADVLAELAYLSPRNKRKGKGGRQPAMDPRLDPNVDPKKAKRILANRLSAARSKMKQKSHVETLRRRIDVLSKQKSDIKASMTAAKSSCESKAGDNDSLRSQIKALEEQCHRQSVITAKLVEERNCILGIAAPLEERALSACDGRTSTAMYVPYPNSRARPLGLDPGASIESRHRASLPPSSRSAKVKDSQTRLSAHQGLSASNSQQHMSRLASAGSDSGQAVGFCDQNEGASLPPSLKTWGSTGKRQPGRPRHKA